MNLHRDEVFPVLEFVGLRSYGRNPRGSPERSAGGRLGEISPSGKLNRATSCPFTYTTAPSSLCSCSFSASSRPGSSTTIARRNHVVMCLLRGSSPNPDPRCLVALAVAELRQALEPRESSNSPSIQFSPGGSPVSGVPPAGVLGDQHCLVHRAGHHFELNPGRLHRLPIGALCRGGDHQIFPPAGFASKTSGSVSSVNFTSPSTANSTRSIAWPPKSALASTCVTPGPRCEIPSVQ